MALNDVSRDGIGLQRRFYPWHREQAPALSGTAAAESDPTLQKQPIAVSLCLLPVPGDRHTALLAMEHRAPPVFIQAVLKWPAQRRRWGQRVSAYLPLQPRSLFRTERGQSRSEFQSPNAAYCTLALASSTRYRRCLEVGEYVRVLYTGPDHHDQSG
ncbi:uncharacterized [Tachysurus ichikawai]